MLVRLDTLSPYVVQASPPKSGRVSDRPLLGAAPRVYDTSCKMEGFNPIFTFLSPMNLQKKLWILFCMLIIGGVLCLNSCLRFRMSPSEERKFFEKRNVKASSITYSVQGRKIHYVSTDDEHVPCVLFLHGSPGSWSAFSEFLVDSLLLSKARLVAVDRPGFGYSDFGHAEPSLAKQSKLLKSLLDSLSRKSKVIAVGHSLGGPLAARLAMDYGPMIKSLVLVAPSIDPALEPKEWFRPPFHSPLLRWLLPGAFRASNEEIVYLYKELDSMKSFWGNITCPVTVIQGDKDGLVDPRNADFAERMLRNAPKKIVRVPGADHFIPWNRPDLIKTAVLEQLTD